MPHCHNLEDSKSKKKFGRTFSLKKRSKSRTSQLDSVGSAAHMINLVPKKQRSRIYDELPTIQLRKKENYFSKLPDNLVLQIFSHVEPLVNFSNLKIFNLAPHSWIPQRDHITGLPCYTILSSICSHWRNLIHSSQYHTVFKASAFFSTAFANNDKCLAAVCLSVHRNIFTLGNIQLLFIEIPYLRVQEYATLVNELLSFKKTIRIIFVNARDITNSADVLHALHHLIQSKLQIIMDTCKRLDIIGDYCKSLIGDLLRIVVLNILASSSREIMIYTDANTIIQVGTFAIFTNFEEKTNLQKLSIISQSIPEDDLWCESFRKFTRTRISDSLTYLQLGWNWLQAASLFRTINNDQDAIDIGNSVLRHLFRLKRANPSIKIIELDHATFFKRGILFGIQGFLKLHSLKVTLSPDAWVWIGRNSTQDAPEFNENWAYRENELLFPAKIFVDWGNIKNTLHSRKVLKESNM
ncbi:hypothetical protein NEOLI_002355 [Neolecta irregularis DAH-3]|uniref:F-box domain-containing protein n=1 Tax=Neolecta irregularis (strain DAH-3) TaxID=1198029 RepID=A0A1U7LV98_NEOID|nr:hypothetical protein NEOLI_002355 [Neolecta irregularis DAH-3]|eukprot:OLL26472.1 hypothetical protein NEOLI_002355 [Neolecta irregularis DAH-3]